MAESTAIDAARQNGNGDHLQPRPRKPTHIELLKVQQLSDESVKQNFSLKDNGYISSGRTTPIPADAPPSVQASSSARRQIRAQQKHRMFPTIEYVDRVSHFDPQSDYHDFRGFFVLFWIGLAIMVLTSMLRKYRDTGYPLAITQWDLFTEKVWELGLSDGAMVASIAVSLPIQKLCMSGWIRWHNLGMAIQSIYQALWLLFWTSYVRGDHVSNSC